MELVVDKEIFFEILKTHSPEESWGIFDSMGLIRDNGRTFEKEVGLFYRVYILTRVKLYHKGLTKVKKQVKLLTDCTYEAISFSKEFDLTYQEGFRKYCEIAASLNILPLHILVYKTEQISEQFSFEQEVNSNPYPNLTEKLVSLYDQEALKRTGFYKPIEEYRDYVHFVRLAKKITELRVNPIEAISTIFEKWEWTRALPNLSLMYSDKTWGDKNKGTIIKPKIKRVKLKKGFERW